MPSWSQKFIIYPIQGLVAWGLNIFFYLLPLDIASATGGWLGRTVGPKLKVSNTARRELARVFPKLNNNEIEKIVIGMWDNLGRTAGEHPHLDKFNPYEENSRVEVLGAEIIDQARDDNLPGIAFSGHLANWELGPLASTKRGLPLRLVYRRANNPFFDRLLQRARASTGAEYLPKGAEGAKDIVRSLSKGEHIAMLVDQKMNDGVMIPFFGREAKTAPALAQLALRYKCPVVPVQVERLKGANFRITVHTPIQSPDTGNKKADIIRMMTDVNKHLEDWIKQKPEQWLWVHNRWPID